MEWDFLGITLRWLHIFAAMALVGGALFQRLALIGPASQLPDDVRQRLNDEIRRRWSKVVMLAILILLVSGLINAVRIIMDYADANVVFQKEYQQLKLPVPLYHILLLVKILIALVIFFIASALSGRGKATARFREQSAKWLSINLLLAVVLVAISGVMRSWHTGPNVGLVKEALNKTDAPPAPAPGGPAPAGTIPAAAGTAPASELPPLDLNIPDGAIPGGK